MRAQQLDESHLDGGGPTGGQIGLTIPVFSLAMIWLKGPLTLGLGGTQIVLLAPTVGVGALTVIPGRATRLQGWLRQVIFFAFVFLAMFP